MRTNLLLAFLVAGASLVSASTDYTGIEVTSPSQLATLLGTPGTTYDFSNFLVPAGTSLAIGCPVLNFTSVCDGQGPGLVPQGIAFTFGGGGGQWDGIGYDGSTSGEILSGSSPASTLTITFTTLATGFAVDLRAFTGYPATAMITIYGVDDATVIGTISNISLPWTGASVFAGFEDYAGIGMAVISQTGQTWSPILDSIEYGDAHVPSQSPEPASLIFVGLGLGGIAIRRLRR